ncbi:MAG TPA: dUTP diphosphatase [Verrucomicrobia bacterium]|nr:dUTP diphosphatase [Verrucomicrobiota bacterium]HCG19944.1 dUTP diphosphatase [Verrucomicrobiota bacterium]
MTLAFKRIHPDAVLPAYAHEGDAGMDVRSVEDVTVPACGRALVHTGLVMLLPDGYEAQVRPRSGLALKSGLTVLNTPGTIDSGYRGEVGVILFNSSKVDFAVRKNDRIAQLVIAPVVHAEVVEEESVDETERGAGGFGSTGSK